MLTEYYFEIEHVKGINNTRADVLSRKVKLQGSMKPLNAILYLDKDGKIRYNYLKLAAVHKALIVNWM